MYRTIDAKFWHDSKVRKLSKDGKLFMLYLVTNPHSHLCGMYYLPNVTVMHETGLKKTELDTLWHTLSAAGLAYRDDEHQVVWVFNMLSYQGKGAKNEAAAAKQLQLFTESPLVASYLVRYPQFQNRVSIGYPKLDSVGTQEQEQEQEQEREQEEDSSEPQAAAEQAVLTFETVGKAKTWNLTQSHIDSLKEAFPDLDILAQCRKARQWCHSHASKRKTPNGMPQFLFRWMDRAQNSSGGTRAGPAGDPRNVQHSLAAFISKGQSNGE